MRKLIILFLAVAVTIFSCDRRPAKANFEGGLAAEYEMSAPKPMAPAKLIKVGESEIFDRKLIKNGEITFSTKDINETRKKLESAATEFNGYVSSEEQQKVRNNMNYHQVIRIPAGRFDAFMKVIESIGDHIEYRNITTQDVTEEFIDLEARLKTKKELEIRYHQLLNRAAKIEDMLSIEDQIAKVRTEIETMQGRLQYLTNQVGYSTLTVNYHQVIVSDSGFATRIASSFATGWNSLLVFLIGITSAWPFILFLTIGIWVVTRWVKRNQFVRNRQAPQDVQ
jgi:hypothetical protein